LKEKEEERLRRWEGEVAAVGGRKGEAAESWAKKRRAGLKHNQVSVQRRWRLVVLRQLSTLL
jgi:hypothetical protein